MDVKCLAENLAIVQHNIAQAAERSGRSAADIMLIGVTKTISADTVQQLVDLGVTHLGENRVQEMRDKMLHVSNNAVWHLIGHLQTNKVKDVVGRVALIHSVDSLRLATEISKKAQSIDSSVDILLEINIADELSKYGVSVKEALELAKQINNLPNIALKGLMTVAPYVEKAENSRIYYKKMTEVFIDIQQKIDDNGNMTFLSMGMTNDYTVAIEEGANIVRIGTGIFGSR
jgi:pyridoxal phosphate enzyme (YggS family)